MVLHHVLQRTGLVVIAGAALQGDGFVPGDLDPGDVVAVPERLEDPVGEPEAEDVLRRLLAEEVVDPEDRPLGERRPEQGVERLGRGESLKPSILDRFDNNAIG